MKPDVKLLGCSNELVEIADDGLGFGLGDADDVNDKSGIEEHRLPSSHRVSADERMFCDDRIAADWTTERI